MMTVPLTLTWMRSPLLPKMSLKSGRIMQLLAERKCYELEEMRKCVPIPISPLIGEVVGYTTPAVKDVGAASIRINFHGIPFIDDLMNTMIDRENHCTNENGLLLELNLNNIQSCYEDVHKWHNIFNYI